jgi:DNA polymerase elongation subunit (family B)
VQVLCEPGEWQYDIVSADANSMFPSVQEAYEFPDIRTCRNVGATPGILDRFLESERYVSWANVRLKAATAMQRFLPNRNEKGRLDWTQDTYSGWLAEPELKYAIYESDWELEEIRELNVAKAHNPFRSHVRKFYDLRQEAKKNGDPRSIFYKLLLNSGYGKFAQRSSVTRMENPQQMEEVFDKDDWEERYELRFYDPVNLEMPFLVDRESLNRTPDSQWFGYASFITSGARVELQKGIHAAGENAKYVDTDSVYMNVDSVKDFEAAIPLGTDLGEWGWEQDRPYAKARFWEPKAYSLHAGDGTLQKAKHKGVDLTDRHGKFLPQAGDLRQTQISTTTTKLYTALRRKLEPGVMQVTQKRSRRWM